MKLSTNNNKNNNNFTLSLLLSLTTLSSSGVLLVNGCETIYDIVCGSDYYELKGFCEVLDTLGLNSTLGDDYGDSTNNSTSTMMTTVFAPTTDALFDAAVLDDIANIDKDDLYEIFSYHVSVEKQRAMYAKDLNCNAGENLLQMMNGKNTRTLCVKGTPTYQKGQGNPSDNDDERLPMFVKVDIEACNGVVHIIDHVLLLSNKGGSSNSEPTTTFVVVPEEETDVVAVETGDIIIATCPIPMTESFFPDMVPVCGEWRYFFPNNTSPWHDIPLMGNYESSTTQQTQTPTPDDNDNDNDSIEKVVYYNFIVEIPKYGRAKLEANTKEEYNPIFQDRKTDKGLRYYPGPIYWNYGFLPQTWEDPNLQDPNYDDDSVFGDNDPVDVVDISNTIYNTGDIVKVKVLGSLALLDQGEIDWKVIVVPIDDIMANEYNDIDDVPLYIKDAIREWFRWYKTPTGDPLNEFGFDGKYLNSSITTNNIITEHHQQYLDLMDGTTVNDEGFWLG